MALASGLAPSRKRRAEWRLFPPYIVYPPPPTQPPVKTTTETTLVPSTRKARLAHSRLAPPRVVTIPTPAEPVKTVLTVRTVAVQTRIERVRRPALFVLQRVVVVNIQYRLGWVATQLAPPPKRGPVTYWLSPPVTPNVEMVVDKITVRLAFTARRTGRGGRL